MALRVAVIVVKEESLKTVLLLCVVWSLWKALAVYTWPFISTWERLLENAAPAPLAYIVLSYAWVAWAVRVLISRYRGEASRRSLLLGLLLALPVVFPLLLLRGVEFDPFVLVLTAVTFSVFGGMVEEVMYRGLLLDTLTARLGPRAAVALQSLVFGLSHPWGWEPIAAATVFGAVMGVLRLKAGIACCIAFHWLINIATHS